MDLYLVTCCKTLIALCKQKAVNAAMFRSFLVISGLRRLTGPSWAGGTPYLERHNLKCGNIQSGESG